MLGLVFIFPILPSISAISSKPASWTVLILWAFITRALIGVCNLAINVFIKNSVTPDLLGSAMGLGQASNSVGSMISPSVYGALYAWSLKNVELGVDGEHVVGFPFNQYFVFLLQAFWAILIAVLTSLLPQSMEKKKVTQ